MPVEWAKAYWTADFSWGKHFHRVGSWIASVWRQKGLYKVYTDLGQLEHTTFKRSSRSTGFAGLNFLPTASKIACREPVQRDSNCQTQAPKMTCTGLWMAYFILISWSMFEKSYREGETEDTSYLMTFYMKKSLFSLLKPENKQTKKMCCFLCH